jgi:hypothetical protein
MTLKRAYWLKWSVGKKEHLARYNKRYRSIPEVAMHRLQTRRQRYANSPRGIMQITLAHGLRRCPTKDPATIDDLMRKFEAQGGRCAVSGIVMTWARGTVLPTSLSLDRINPNGGYSVDNIRLICHAINAFKGRMLDTEMIEMARAIIARVPEPWWSLSEGC